MSSKINFVNFGMTTILNSQDIYRGDVCDCEW